MQQDDLVEKIDSLLKHFRGGTPTARYLRAARKRAHEACATQLDYEYVLSLLEKLGPPSVTSSGSTPQDSLRTMAVELEKAKETIARLRETGKRAVAQRDEWEAIAKALQKQLEQLQPNGKPDHKFEEAKRAFAKLYHPNTFASRSPLESIVRTEIFKEFWSELERIGSQT